MKLRHTLIAASLGTSLAVSGLAFAQAGSAGGAGTGAARIGSSSTGGTA